MLITRRVATGLLLVPLGGIRFAGAQPAAATAQVTFVLVNDIYLMSDTCRTEARSGSRGGGGGQGRARAGCRRRPGDLRPCRRHACLADVGIDQGAAS